MTSPSPPTPKRPLYQNIISQLGMLIALGGSVIIALLMLAQMVAPTSNPYLGMFTFMLLPGVILVGIVAILGGMRWEAGRRKRKASLASLPYPRMDLNDPRQRRFFNIAVLLSAVVGTTLIWTGYEGYIYTESVSFCGQTCHTTMMPEYTAYLDSAHARVRCVDCHVGEGATYYVRSKIQGAHQLWALITHSYARPIATPILNLRPARETCERCHWPEKFFGAKLLQLPHYRYDEANTPEQITLTLKTGGGTKTHGASGGVHWHMMIDNQVTFGTTDPQLQDIPWVQVRNSSGRVVTYVSKLARLSEDQISKLPKHVMDCMDCHNRPAHDFPSPDGGIDQALYKGHISATLPWIKKLVVEAMMAEYPTREAAHRAIRDAVVGNYQAKYPEVLAQRRGEVDQAIDVASRIYDRAVFPDMRVNWHTYPVNIGHRHWPGCFRCHDGLHVSSDGKVLGNDCSKTCHTQPQRGAQTALGVVDPAATADWHPWQLPIKSLDIPGHQQLQCASCHKAGRGPKNGCDDCHSKND
jgi:nitrate/TMAO reductase-like tetraheme cytochrome c subunit